MLCFLRKTGQRQCARRKKQREMELYVGKTNSTRLSQKKRARATSLVGKAVRVGWCIQICLLRLASISIGFFLHCMPSVGSPLLFWLPWLLSSRFCSH